MVKQSRKLTLQDIGNLAGVSRATVSRVINNYPHITPEVRERVQSVIEDTGYQPNRIAQSLASSRTGVIGLVIPHVATTVFTNPYFLHLINSITRATNQIDLTLSLFLFHSVDEEERIAKSVFSTNLVDGIIITADRKEDSFLEHVQRFDIPVVFVGKPEMDIEIPYVNADNEAGGYIATRHLIEQGRSRVATIMVAHNTAGEDRYAGYRRAFAEFQLQVDDTLVAEGDFSLESGYQTMKNLLSAAPDAVFVASDLMAIGAQRAIREAGLRVPEDIAMVGVDDLPEAVQAEIPLTTIRQPVDRMGPVAVELLQSQINQTPNVVKTRILPVELVIRES